MTEPSRPARLWYQSFVHPTEQRPYIERLQALLDAAAAPGIRFEVHGLEPPDHLFHPLTEFRCAAQTIRNALDAERRIRRVRHRSLPGARPFGNPRCGRYPRDWSRRSDTACSIEHGAPTWSGDHRSDLYRLA